MVPVVYRGPPYIADFLQDTDGYEIIEKYLIENICYDNIAEIMAQTDKFDEQIFVYASKYLSEKLSRSTIENFCKKLAGLDNDRFGKIIITLEESFGRNWIEMMSCYRATLDYDQGKANDIFKNLIKDDQYLNIRKLQLLIQSASKGPGIDLSISTLRGEYGILIKKTTKPEWETGQLIFPNVTIDQCCLCSVLNTYGIKYLLTLFYVVITSVSVDLIT